MRNAKSYQENVTLAERHRAVSSRLLTDCAAKIVVAYVCKGNVPAEALTAVIRNVHHSLESLAHPVVETAPLRPAVPVTDSITPDYLICLEDGKPLRTLKRYLMRRYGLTPTEYRERWGLSGSYPMIAPSYKQERQQMAIRTGLGKKRDRTPIAVGSMDDDHTTGS